MRRVNDCLYVKEFTGSDGKLAQDHWRLGGERVRLRCYDVKLVSRAWYDDSRLDSEAKLGSYFRHTRQITTLGIPTNCNIKAVLKDDPQQTADIGAVRLTMHRHYGDEDYEEAASKKAQEYAPNREEMALTPGEWTASLRPMLKHIQGTLYVHLGENGEKTETFLDLCLSPGAFDDLWNVLQANKANDLHVEAYVMVLQSELERALGSGLPYRKDYVVEADRSLGALPGLVLASLPPILLQPEVKSDFDGDKSQPPLDYQRLAVERLDNLLEQQRTSVNTLARLLLCVCVGLAILILWGR